MPIWVTPTILRYAAIAVAVMTLTIGAYMRGRHVVQVKFDTYKAEVKAAADEQARESAKVDSRNKKLFEDSQNAYNTSLANLRAYYSMRLGKSGSSLPQVPGTATGVNDYSPDNLPPAAVLAGQCAETTLNLLSLQNFVRGAINNAE